MVPNIKLEMGYWACHHESQAGVLWGLFGILAGFGEVAEWSKAAVLKTVDSRGSGGSNPSLSAKQELRLKSRLRRPILEAGAPQGSPVPGDFE